MRQDLAGQVFGRLTVISFSHADAKRYSVWNCSCACGGSKQVTTWNLRRGRVASCGCLHQESARRRGKLNRSVPVGAEGEYLVWLGVKSRCSKTQSHNYKRYGGRGITMHPAWKHDFLAFLHDVGPRPDSEHQLDRINNDGNYEPGNVRWATRVENSNNKSNSRFLTFRGETRTVAQWARHVGLKPCTLHSRLDAGWNLERALTAPLVYKPHQQA